jgi:uncharacterized membrane protein
MIASGKIQVFALAFGVAYAAIYVICTELNLPLVTYHPVTGEIDLLWQPPKRGPAMYWYGWMLTSLVGAFVLALIATAIPEPWLQRAIMFGCVAAVAYLILYTVALFIYDKATVELEILKSRWLAAAAALVAAGIVSYVVPSQWNQRVWHGWIWVVPIGSLAVLAYYLTPYFTR